MRRILRVLLLLLLILGSVGVVAAAQLLREYECEVPADVVIEGNVFVLCRDVIINGTIEGHLIGASVTTTINGSVAKNIYMLTGQMDMEGTLDGDLHFAGVALNVLPESTLSESSDVVTLALSAQLYPEARIPGGIVGLGYQWVIQGDVADNVDFAGATLYLSGAVGGDVQVSVGDSATNGVASQIETLLLPFNFDVDLIDPGLIVTESGAIDGLLSYRAVSPGRIDAELARPPVYYVIPSSPTLIELVEEEDPSGALQTYFYQVIREVTTLGVIGLLGLLLLPQAFRLPIQSLRRQALPSLGVGLLTFVISFPVVLILLILSLLLLIILGLLRLDGLVTVGALLLGVVNFGGASIFYFIAIFVSRAILALALGRFFVRFFVDNLGTVRSWFLSLGIGVVILALFASLPVVGWIINALSLFLGLGAILIVIQSQMRLVREDTPAPVYYSRDTITLPPQMPPPMLSDKPQVRGMDNLPEGFTWWDED